MTTASEAQKLHLGLLIESSRAILDESQKFKLIITTPYRRTHPAGECVSRCETTNDKDLHRIPQSQLQACAFHARRVSSEVI